MTSNRAQAREVVRALLTVREACEAMSIGRTTLYGLIQAETICVMKIGKRGIRVPASEIERFVREGGADGS